MWRTLLPGRVGNSIWGEGVLVQYLGIGEPLRVWNPNPFRTKNSKIHALFRTTNLVLLPFLGQRTKCTPCSFVGIAGSCSTANSCYACSHCFCLIGVQTNFIPCLWPDGTKLYTLFRTDREEKNHSLSRGTSPYRPYKEVLPRGELRGSVLEISWARKMIGEVFRVSQIE